MLWREVEKNIHLHDLHIEVCVYAFYRLYEHGYFSYIRPPTPRLLLVFTSRVQVIDSIFAHYFLLIVILSNPQFSQNRDPASEKYLTSL